MTQPNRADPFADVPTLDVSSFKPAAPKEKQPREHVRQIAEAHNFPSRESRSTPPAVAKQQRRHRTGRNVQINIKATSTAIERFMAIADREKWVLGEAFERATDALEKSLKA
ncbi:MAG: stability/partitioning determinant [Alphaproteobacteria bacterium]|nr:stability/partitioning determinant [Alphaproteobacteria bacterium]